MKHVLHLFACLLLICILFGVLPVQAQESAADTELKSLQQPTLKEVPESVGLADWPALARALRKDGNVTGRIVSFRELWSAAPGALTEPIAISGVILRRFRREPLGQFPALEELWLRTDDDALVIVTYRSSEKKSESTDTTAPGSAVDVTGTFLRNVRYEAKDEPRVAPWVVASLVRPMGTSLDGSGTASSERDSPDDMRKIGLVLLAVVTCTALLRLVIDFARKSGRRRR